MVHVIGGRCDRGVTEHRNPEAIGLLCPADAVFMKNVTEKGQTVRRASRQPPGVSRAKGVRSFGAASAWTGMWCRRSRPRPSRKSSTSTYQIRCVARASRALRPLVAGPSRSSPRVGPTPCADSRGTLQDPLARLAQPSQRPHPTLTDHRELKDDAVRAGGSPLPDYDAVPVRPSRSPLAPPGFPSSSPTLGFPPSSRATAPSPIPPTRRLPPPHEAEEKRGLRAWFRPGRVWIGDIGLFRATGGNESVRYLQVVGGTRAAGCWIVSHRARRRTAVSSPPPI